MSERFALPGFQSPGSPREGERIFAAHSGQIEAIVLANRPETEPYPYFEIYLLLGISDQCPFAFSTSNRYVFEHRKENGIRDFVVRFTPMELSVVPGTYIMIAMAGGAEVFRKSLVVRDHPMRASKLYPDAVPSEEANTHVSPPVIVSKQLVIHEYADPNSAGVFPPNKDFGACYTVPEGGVLWEWDYTLHGTRPTSQTWIPINIQY